MRAPTFGDVTPATRSLFTDLYELRMMQASHGHGPNPTVTFDLFVRKLLPDRGYLVAARRAQTLSKLSESYRSLREPDTSPVETSDGLRAEMEAFERSYRDRTGG
ncbi:nicotinate phosphoribosyltransferase [Halogranum amylolyticum]|uniref:Nicotinate phosphoribosyltransferase n=1 Tax=Halogranum amylolyticum TaxID=660520 RepID=A0A1H8MWR7_9EURY|nr:hypothetical protein [Halogranum amylolyticum]SEO21698.1 nicotinate phosphoribosyltransferase [Halogranum amylolyticum]